MKKRLLFVYYAVLILVLSCQAIYTVYKLGGTIGQGEKLGSLQQEQQALEKELRLLQETHSTETALTTLAESAEDYQPIQKPIILSTVESVASR